MLYFTRMSSFNVHRKEVLDSSNDITHRYSHARSCLNKVANFTGLTRSELILKAEKVTGVNLDINTDEEQLLKGFQYLVTLRESRLKIL